MTELVSFLIVAGAYFFIAGLLMYMMYQLGHILHELRRHNAHVIPPRLPRKS